MNINKKTLFTILFVLSSTLLFQGCSNKSTEKKAPIWNTVKEVDIKQASNYNGFLNKTFAISVGYAGEVHYTNDGGKTWPQGQNESRCRFGLDIVNENIAWNCGNGASVRVTKDGGKTWQEVADFGDNEPDQCRFLSFLDDSTGWIASPGRLASTSDGGKTWSELKLPEGAEQIASMTLRTANDGYILNPSGILFITKDGGKTWSQIDLNLKQFNFKNGKLITLDVPTATIGFSDANNATVTISGQSDGVLKAYLMETKDCGKTWTHQPIKGMRSYYLSHDGKFLTMTDFSNKVTLLEKQ